MGRRWRGRRHALLLVVALVAAVAGVGAYELRIMRQPELATVDARFTLRGTQKPPPNIVLVKIDDVTFGDLKVRWPFPRLLHAQLIDRLRQAGARAIGYDVQFTEPTDPKDDNALLDAVSKTRGVVLATTEVGAHGSTNIFGGDSVLREVGGHAGNSNLPADADGTLRRLPFSIDGLRTFAVVLAEQTKRRPVPPPSFPSDGTPIDYAGPPGTIRSISFSDVLRGRFPPGLFRGATVVVGPTAPSLQDVHATSASRSELMPGGEIQANAVATVLHGNPLTDSSRALDILLIVLLAVAAPLASLRLSLGPATAIGVGLAALYTVGVQLAFNDGLILPLVYPLLGAALAMVGTLGVNFVIASFEKDRVRETFARFVPERVVDEALATAEGQRLGGVRRECTVLFSDIRGFTTFSETRPPDEVIHVLNHYLTEMSAAIMDHGGTLISYIGDGIMALFGAPLEQADHADRALAAAREMVGARLAKVNEWLVGEGLEPFRMGVGLNSGVVMAGNVGSDQRLEYTAIGDTVNTASRLEGMTKNSGFEVFVSGATHDALTRGDEGLEYVGELEVRGRLHALGVWGVRQAAEPVAQREGVPVSPGRDLGVPSDRQLAAVPVFAGLARDDRRRLAERARLVSFGAGDTVVAEDAPATRFFAILDGSAGVFRNNGEVARLGPGDFFGELGVFSRGALQSGRRSATVIAGTDLDVVAIGEPDIRALAREIPELGEAIAQAGIERRGVLVEGE